MSLDAARVAPEKAVLRPALPMFLRPGWNGTNVGTKRKTISKTTRFEVFKRDSFKCQYCGAMAPDVLLEIDHIQPVSKGGEESMLNYLTACKPCNAGKGARTLEDGSAVLKQQAQLTELQERREQIEMMLQWRDGLKDIEAEQVQIIAKAWAAVVPSWHLNETGLKEARTLLKKHGLQRVLDAIDTAAEKYVQVVEGKATQDSVNAGWSKLAGICALQALPEDERRLYYIRGILNRRLNYMPFDALETLRDALASGCSIDEMEREAKRCTTWRRYQDWLLGLN